MTKKKVYLVQINVTYSDKIAYIPYAAGCIQAYALADNDITAAYDFGELTFIRETPDKVIERFDNPYLIGFSCYTWNIEYNKTVAAKIKEKWPECIIVFGGHEVPADGSMLDSLPTVDCLLHGEGEETFAALLKALDSGAALDTVGNLSFRREGKAVTTPTRYAFDVSSYPSPYTSGVFDRIIEYYPSSVFNAILETNRGCPYGCAYCDWCFTKKIRYFPMEKIKAEIDWMSEKKLPYCYCADANFGINERDVEIARYVVDKHNATGFPGVFKPCYAKDSDDTVFAAGKLLNDAGADKGVTLAYQSLSGEALRNIGRSNLTLEHFAALDARYNAADIPTYTELILGMPGETYESFCRGMCELLERGQHNSMTVYNCQVYANSPMGDPEYQKKFGIKTTRIQLHGIHYPLDFNGVPEYYNIIYETASMPKEDWVRANMFSIVLQAFHHLGLLRCFAIYLRMEKNVSYFDFYSKLLDYVFADKSSGSYAVFEDMRSRTAHVEKGDWTYQKDAFSKVGWYFEEGAFLELAYRGEEFWNEIEPFLKSFGIENKIFTALLDYQKSIIRRPLINSAVIDSDYDFYSYFESIYAAQYSPLAARRTRLTIEAEKQITDWAQYAIEIIWFGKRRSATLLTNPREKITLEYI